MIEYLEHHLFTCSIKGLFGVECPGCGMQRAFIALLKGDLLQSLGLNASLLPFLLTLLYTGLHLVFGFKNGPRLIVIFFGITVLAMLGSFVSKLLLPH